MLKIKWELANKNLELLKLTDKPQKINIKEPLLIYKMLEAIFKMQKEENSLLIYQLLMLKMHYL